MIQIQAKGVQVNKQNPLWVLKSARTICLGVFGGVLEKVSNLGLFCRRVAGAQGRELGTIATYFRGSLGCC